MTNEEILAKAYLDSGCIEPFNEGFKCNVCGEYTSWNDVLKIKHASWCELHNTIDHLHEHMHYEATLGETDIADSLRMQFETALPPYKLIQIDQLVDGVCAAETVGEALAGVEHIMESCPYANRDFLTVFAAGLYRSAEQRQALRDYLVFEFAVADKEKELRKQLESAKRDIKLLTAQLAQTALTGHVTKRLI